MVPAGWRGYAAIVACTLKTPIGEVMNMEWCELLGWYCEAVNIQMARARFDVALATGRRI
ncbi:hypothetical protein DEM27_15395 [Metarhizobium album]|uniref:Uncharacterized protein n=1 Tax=Metarhizobium album TaxID=2182425 RepID=A0A2U2DQE4_9HYPH|nr:hypothetical protein DEM27_15395 [Rhizobium album]